MIIFHIVRLILFFIAFAFLLLVFCINPGYIKSQNEIDFLKYLDKAIKEKRNLEYFCFYCRCLLSATSDHC